MTVLRLERYQVDPRRRADFDAQVGQVLDAMRASGGFLWCDAAASRLDADGTLLVSEWRTRADADAFVAAEAYRAFRDAVDVALHEDPTCREFEPLDPRG